MTRRSVSELIQDMHRAASLMGAHPSCARATWEDRLLWLRELRALDESLGQFEACIEAAVVREMPDDRVVVGDLVAERVHTSRSGQWDDDEVSRRLVEAVCHDPWTGEIGDTATAARVRSGFMLACRPAWRVTALRSLGVDYKDLVNPLRGRRRVKIY